MNECSALQRTSLPVCAYVSSSASIRTAGFRLQAASSLFPLAAVALLSLFLPAVLFSPAPHCHEELTSQDAPLETKKMFLVFLAVWNRNAKRLQQASVETLEIRGESTITDSDKDSDSDRGALSVASLRLFCLLVSSVPAAPFASPLFVASGVASCRSVGSNRRQEEAQQRDTHKQTQKHTEGTLPLVPGCKLPKDSQLGLGRLLGHPCSFLSLDS